MFRFGRVSRSAIAVSVVAVVGSCTSDDLNEVLGPRPKGFNAMFQNYVAIGNSITAGYQSGGIMDSTQRRSYAALLAGQMGTRFAFPSLAGRGCNPPIINFTTQVGFGNVSASSRSLTCDLRNPTSATDILNNVAVPGATVADITAASGTTASNTLTSLFLGGKTQVQKALDASPTFASVWIGNNDVLAPAVSGVLVPMTGVSPGVTAQTAFQTSYDAAISQLTAGAPGLAGVLIGVGNVTNIPLLFPVAVLQTNAAFLAGFDQAAGRVPTSTDPVKAAAMTIDPNCTGAGATLISFRIVSEIAKFRNDTNATGQPPKSITARAGHPAHIACGPNSVGFPATVGDIFILTTTEQAALATAVADYNTYISGKATALGWAYMNPNILLDSLKTAGQIPVAPNLASATATFGAWLSLDGVHPSTQAHRAITNHVVNAINAKYATTLTTISVP